MKLLCNNIYTLFIMSLFLRDSEQSFYNAGKLLKKDVLTNNSNLDAIFKIFKKVHKMFYNILNI